MNSMHNSTAADVNLILYIMFLFDYPIPSYTSSMHLTGSDQLNSVICVNSSSISPLTVYGRSGFELKIDHHLTLVATLVHWKFDNVFVILGLDHTITGSMLWIIGKNAVFTRSFVVEAHTVHLL